MSRRIRTRFARLSVRPLEDRLVPATTFKVLSLDTANSVAVEHSAVTGDDFGGIAVSNSHLFVTGNTATARFNRTNLSGAASTGFLYEALTGDLRSQKVYSFGSGPGAPTTQSSLFADRLLEVNGTTGALTGTEIVLSEFIPIGFDTGFFAGYDRVVVHPSNGAVYEINPANGQVTILSGFLPNAPHQNGAGWAYFGVAEHFGGVDYLAYVDTPTSIARQRVDNGAVTNLASFPGLGLGDMDTFTVSPGNSRWYFHNEGLSVFAAGAQPDDEVAGYADATFQVGDFIVTNLLNSGTGSLRDVIALANAAGPNQPITFQPGLTGTINLTTPISVTQPVDLLGPGSAVITVTGGHNLFAPSAGVGLAAQGLTLNGTAGPGLTVGYALTANNDLRVTGANVAVTGALSTNDVVVISAGAGNVSFAGGVTVTAGTLTVTDGNAVELGPTTVVNGTLAHANPGNGFNVGLGGALTGTGSVTGSVFTEGTLGGSLTVNGNVTVAAGGIVAPGPGVDSVVVTGNLTFNAGGTFTADINGNGSADQLVVGGTVDIGTGSFLSPVFGAGPTPGDANVLIDNGGSDPLVGSIDGIRNRSGRAYGGSFFQIRYDGGSGNDLELVANSSPVIDPNIDTRLTPILEDVPPSSNPGTSVDALVASGGLYADAEGPFRSGLAFTASDTANGTWQFSRNGGTSWTNFVGLTNANATLLEADGAGQNRVRFQPAANLFGRATLTFKAWDTTNGLLDGTTGANATAGGFNSPYSSAAETASIDVLAVNDPPVPGDDFFSVAEDTNLNRPAGQIQSNDTDVDGPFPLTVALVSGPAHGSLGLLADGSFNYLPDPNYNGPDAFTYKAIDGSGEFGVGVVYLTVTAVNDNPAAGDDTISLPEDGGPVPVDVLADDTIAPDAGETLTVSAVTQGANGSVAIAADLKSVTYTPAKDYNGPDSFTYTISDGNGGSATATVAVTVTAVNDPPVANNDTAALVEDGGPQSIDVLVNDTTGPDAGETLTVAEVTQGLHGTVTIGPGGLSIRYQPNADFSGMDQFLYTIADGNGGTAAAAVVVNVANDGADRLEVVPSVTLVTFTESVPPPSLPIALDAGIRVGTALEGVLTGATVKFAAGYVKKKDTLRWTPVAGVPIKGTFAAGTGILKLTGTAFPADYEAALRRVQYFNGSPAPVDGLRTVAVQLQDAAGVGGAAAFSLRVIGVNTAPTLSFPTTLKPAAFKLGKAPVAVTGPLKIVDVDNTRLLGATVSIGTNRQVDDVLTINKLTTGIVFGISFSYANGVLTLTGNATRATYLKVLKLVKFGATSGPGLTRSLSFQVFDGNLQSNTVSRDVTVG